MRAGGDDGTLAHDSGTVRRRIRARRVLARLALGCAVLCGFEFVLYTAALTLFTHLDTPVCAGADTFCSPDGRPGVTGGAVVMLVGNLAAATGIAVLVLLLHRRRLPGARS